MNFKTFGLLGLIGLSAVSANALENKANDAQSKNTSYPINKSTSSYNVNNSTNVVQAKPATSLKSKQQQKNNQFYLVSNYSMLNPSAYNGKIKEVSVGDVYGSVASAGIGYERKVFGIPLYLELTQNCQQKDSDKISGGSIETFGYNQLGLTNLDLEALLKKKLAGPLSLEAGLGIATTHIYMESANEVEKISCRTSTEGMKASLALAYSTDKMLTRLKVAYRTGSQECLDVSSLNLGLNVGWEF